MRSSLEDAVRNGTRGMYMTLLDGLVGARTFR